MAEHLHVGVALDGYGWHPQAWRRAWDDADLEDLFDEAADAVDVVRRLWDSWEDDAVIRDVATGRFVDRDKLHYIDFTGRFFSVKGPSITPRPPQGQPVVAVLAHAPRVYEFAARSADLVFVTPTDDELVDLLLGWQRLGVDGVRLRPAVNATDLPGIVDEVVPRLQRAGHFRSAYANEESLRTRLGLPVAENRYGKARTS
jgi:alkanesulfonate monooxygenase SsuD/methylene tetrahydromethanopterin reductase-like flavin-dependent oxidoreductase (luciferase family)